MAKQGVSRAAKLRMHNAAEKFADKESAGLKGAQKERRQKSVTVSYAPSKNRATAMLGYD